MSNNKGLPSYWDLVDALAGMACQFLCGPNEKIDDHSVSAGECAVEQLRRLGLVSDGHLVDDVFAVTKSRFEHYRPVMSKSNWNDAPEWAQWLAMDSDGKWYWFEVGPTVGEDCFNPDFSKRCERAAVNFPGWTDTLEPRP